MKRLIYFLIAITLIVIACEQVNPPSDFVPSSDQNITSGEDPNYQDDDDDDGGDDDDN